jgi:ureidoglycolate dehydrogenase (NAD+)
MVLVSVKDLAAWSVNAFTAVGVPKTDAESAVEILVSADLQGIDTHGVRRIPAYVARIRDGIFNPAPDISVEQRGDSAAVVDGDDGLGPVVGSFGLKTALRLAEKTGVGYVGCRNSQHFGALAPYARHATQAGFVCFLGTNAFTTMAPTGGREIRLGNNPLGLGAPRADAPPFILDIAMSVAARGKMRAAAEKGEPIPEGWALDADGNPTTDPEKGLAGFVLPIGGHKGYGLAMMVDILAGALSGGAVSTEVKSLFQQKDQPQKVCHYFIAIDPEKTIGRDAFLNRMAVLCDLMKSTTPFKDGAPVLIPGEIEARRFETRSENGIPLDPDFVDELQSMAKGAPPRAVASA